MTIACEFLATISINLDLDPAEFSGMTVGEIEAALCGMLDEMHPELNFFPDDVRDAAHALAEVTDAPTQ